MNNATAKKFLSEVRTLILKSTDMLKIAGEYDEDIAFECSQLSIELSIISTKIENRLLKILEMKENDLSGKMQ